MRTKPTVDDRKIPRSVSIRQSVDRMAKEHAIDLGQIVEDAVMMACGSDPEEIELGKLEKEISRLKSDLAPKLSRLAYLKESVSRKKKLQNDLMMERECHAWYLRSLVQSGIIRVMSTESVDPSNIVKLLIKEGSISSSDVEPEGTGWKISSSASAKGKKYLSNLVDKDGNLVPTESRTWVSPSKDDLLSKYSISLDFNKLSSEVMAHQIGDEPVEYYMQFDPRIVSDRVKAEIKKKMEPHYISASVEVTDA